MDEINVIVVKRKDRKNLCLRYTDPVTGKRHEKNSGTTSQKQAQRAAGEWQSELSRGLDERGKIVTWAEFRQRYDDDQVSAMKPSTQVTVDGVFNTFERLLKPDKLTRISPQWLTRFVKLRAAEVEQSTIAGDFRVLKAAMNWAKSQGLINAVPEFPKLKKARKAKAMKGRAITSEEFERMLAAADSVKNCDTADMKFLLNGLWVSGLRLGEAMSLTWDTWADGIRVDMSGDSAVLLIAAEDDKGGQDREYGVAPEFDDFLRAVPKSDRTGHVFNVKLTRGIVCRNSNTVSRKIVAIGKAANVKVDQRQAIDRKTKKRETQVVWGSAHDLRRAFGHRWAKRVMPMVLKELMRHQTVLTTEKYYVGIKAQETAQHLREVMAAEQQRQASNFTPEVTNEVTSESAEVR